MTIPEFLLRNVEAFSNDRRKMMTNLQLLLLWREVYPSKPYDHKVAIELQRRLAMQKTILLAKKAEKALRIEKQNIKVLLESCRIVAENVLVVEVNCDADMVAVGDNVDFDSHVKDVFKKDGLLERDYGTVRNILLEHNFNWTDCGDPREDLKGFIVNLKKYDDMLIPIVFERERMIDKRERFCKFTIKLTWRSVSDFEMKTKFRKFLKEKVTQVV